MNGKYTRTPRTLRHRGVKDDERRVSHYRKEHEEPGGEKKVAAVEPPVCQFS